MAAAGLGGAAMAAPVMGYDAIAVLEEEQHLRVPIIGRQRPAVAEHDGLTFVPVLVEDLNAVFGGDRVHSTRCWATGGGGRPRPGICGNRRRRHCRGGKRGGAADQKVSARCATICSSVLSHRLGLNEAANERERRVRNLAPAAVDHQRVPPVLHLHNLGHPTVLLLLLE